MVSGFGIIDFIVVFACMVLTGYLLMSKPKQLLLFLPTLVTLDFFIPLVSQLTPGRLVPLMIGAWWCYSGRFPTKPPVGRWLAAGLVFTMGATVLALLHGDSGARPVIRSLNYLNLLILCGFAWQFTRGKAGIMLLFRGFALAGLIHGFYSIYQVIANRLGLPYRGIVYSASGRGGSGSMAEGGFRVNGFADEPKRLGLILLAGTIALLFLAARERRVSQKHVMQGLAILILLVSFLTYSTSYLVALVVSVPVIMLLSPRSWKYGFGLAGMTAVVMIFMQDSVGNYVMAQKKLLESREREMEQGLDARKVYRQEFFAQDYLEENPSTLLPGVGMGRYYEVFRKTYGPGAGKGFDGSLQPLNSQAFELIYDTGIAGLLLVYVGGVLIVVKVRNRGTAGYMVAVIITFELIQSLFVQALPILVLAFGAGAAVIWSKPPKKKIRRIQGRKTPADKVRGSIVGDLRS